jgi:hypothetical protein
LVATEIKVAEPIMRLGVRALRVFPLLLITQLVPTSVSGQSLETRFWAWFQQHDSALFAVKSGTEPVCDELSEQLHRISPDLTFELGPVQSGKREFVISADGVREAFPAVLALGAAAPALVHWTIIRFRPPRPDVTQIQLAAVHLDADSVEFLAEPDGDRTGLTISVPNYKPTPEHAYEQGVYLLLDGMLGEYTVETAVGFVETVAPVGRRPGHWRPLIQIQQVVKLRQPN